MTEIERLRDARPKNRFGRWTAAALAALAVYAWLSGEIQVGEIFTERRRENLERFLTKDVVPPSWSEAGRRLADRGARGAVATLAISVLAIALAGLAGLALSLPAARTFLTPEAYLPHSRPPGRARRAAYGAVVYSTRALQLFLRSIPEFVWAYLFLAMLGPSAWPAILALAMHNAGILGKLGAETVENLESAPLRSLRGLGAGRMSIAASAILPAALPRFLLYFFYRFETCVREATVLGMLGIVSLGYWIADARAKRFYDEMLLLVLAGAALVLVADLLSALTRRWIRRGV